MEQMEHKNRRNKSNNNFIPNCNKLIKQIELNKSKGLVTKLFNISSISVEQIQYFVFYFIFLLLY